MFYLVSQYIFLNDSALINMEVKLPLPIIRLKVIYFNDRVLTETTT